MDIWQSAQPESRSRQQRLARPIFRQHLPRLRSARRRRHRRNASAGHAGRKRRCRSSFERPESYRYTATTRPTIFKLNQAKQPTTPPDVTTISIPQVAGQNPITTPRIATRFPAPHRDGCAGQQRRNPPHHPQSHRRRRSIPPANSATACRPSPR